LTPGARWAPLLAAAGVFAAMRLLPAPEALPAAGWAVAALAVTMAILWLTEALPLALTATLPFIALPLLGVMPAGEVAGLYWSPILFLVLGGAILAIAVETHGLHRRLALAIVGRAPASPTGLLAALMAATALISMVVSNTATALIMMPVALAVIAAMEADGDVAIGSGARAALVLGVAYAANLGGMGTLVGTPTNAISAGIIERALGLKVDFLTWMAFGLPLVLLAVPAAWAILVLLLKVPSTGLGRARVRDLIGDPGPLGADQKRLLPLMGLLLLGWVVLPLVGPSLGIAPIEDGIVAMAVALLMFVVPSANGGPLLEWRAAVTRIPWEILLLFGGGLALAGAITQSGLAAAIGREMALLGGLSPLLLAALVVGVVVLVTEFASNVAAASAFMPVVAAVALETGADPLPLVMAAAFASSWGFMMPSGTPPNALAFATGEVTIGQMIRAGLLLNLVGVVLMVGVTFVVGALL
jgi:solute carrier family 13 (sodium-dependent dicarboxylate transporter), member 2/3/5